MASYQVHDWHDAATFRGQLPHVIENCAGKKLMEILLVQGTEGVAATMQGLASGNSMAAELERVLYVQMLVLFAPQAVPAAAHLPLLVHTLQAPQPFLRQAAAATLRHLAGGWTVLRSGLDLAQG